MWEVFKQVKVNIPLLDAIKQVPAYAKYLKDLCTQKRQHKFPKKIDLTENVSSVLSGTLPSKLRDPGAPLIPIQVGEFQMDKALLDLGASVSILPGSLYDQYDFGPLKKANTTVVMADLTPKLPRGIVYDVIVKVEDFYYPVDFLVLDYVSVDKNRQPNIILGRPFLATTHALIDCRNGTVEMAFGNKKLKLNVFSSTSNALVSDVCFIADTIDGCQPHQNEVDTTEKFAIFDRAAVVEVEVQDEGTEDDPDLDADIEWIEELRVDMVLSEDGDFNLLSDEEIDEFLNTNWDEVTLTTESEKNINTEVAGVAELKCGNIHTPGKSLLPSIVLVPPVDEFGINDKPSINFVDIGNFDANDCHVLANCEFIGGYASEKIVGVKVPWEPP